MDKNSKIKALFFDIDGTLVSFQTHRIPQSTVEALEKAKQNGVKIYISTGRPIILITNLGQIEHLIDGYITTNGARCFVENHTVCQCPILRSDVEKVSFGFFKDDAKAGTISQTSDDSDFGTIHLNLAAGTYEVVAIGHNGSGTTISSPEKITFTSNKVTDTFYYYGILDVIDGEKATESITLKRAVGMFRLVIKDEIPEQAKKIKFYYTGGSSTLNAKTGYGCVNSKQTEILDLVKNQQVYEVYTFPHEGDKKLTVSIDILDKNDFTIATTTFSDVPILKNYITKYSGKLFTGLSGGTGDIDIDFVFDPEWAGENEYEF